MMGLMVRADESLDMVIRCCLHGTTGNVIIKAPPEHPLNFDSPALGEVLIRRVRALLPLTLCWPGKSL